MPSVTFDVKPLVEKLLQEALKPLKDRIEVLEKKVAAQDRDIRRAKRMSRE